ncbi:helix-turn-helix transcriptional regulator [Sungkyunkwania multivorans]|uniref:Helix-turn-helix transcriptional regulator n=1 Tax=Sungkyunkwania multivorans TaxID=1173618 RepID=A0ABW3CT58_9FLAO
MKSGIPIEARRFKQIREERGYTQQSFAELLNIGSSTVDIERGKTKISGWIVAALLDRYNLNPLWLYGKSHIKELTVSSVDVSPKVICLDTNDNDSILLVNQRAAAGYPQNIHDVSWYDTLPAFNIPLPEYRNATYRGFQVEGDSMLPNIRPREWVLGKAVANFSEASDGKIYIVVLKDSVLVKKLQKNQLNPALATLISLNKEYAPYPIKVEDIQELWMVNSKLTFGIDEPSDSSLLEELRASMEELKSKINKLEVSYKGPELSQ